MNDYGDQGSPHHVGMPAEEKTGTDTKLEELEKLAHALEAGGRPGLRDIVSDGVLEVKSALQDFPGAFAPLVRDFFADPKHAVKSKVLVAATKSGTHHIVWPCQYLSAKVPVDKLEAGYKLLGKVLEQLLEDDLVMGYLAAPSSIALANPLTSDPPNDMLNGMRAFVANPSDEERAKVKPPSSYYGPAVQAAVFAFIFTKLTTQELHARFPRWGVHEGQLGPALED